MDGRAGDGWMGLGLGKMGMDGWVDGVRGGVRGGGWMGGVRGVQWGRWGWMGLGLGNRECGGEGRRDRERDGHGWRLATSQPGGGVRGGLGSLAEHTGA